MTSDAGGVMCGGGVRSILLLPLVTRCLDNRCMYVVVNVCCVAVVVEHSVF